MTFFKDLTSKSLVLSQSTAPSHFLRILLLKKKFFMIFFRNYTLNKTKLFRKHHSFIYLKFKKKNLFITVCNDLNKSKFTYTLGMDKLKNKKSRFSRHTIRLIRQRLKNVLALNSFTNYTLFYKGRKKQVKKYAKFFSKYLFFMSSLIFFIRVTPHGGCRPSKKKRR